MREPKRYSCLAGLVCLWLLGVAWCGAAFAAERPFVLSSTIDGRDISPYLEYAVDSTRRLNIADVAANKLSFRPVLLARHPMPFTGNAYWFRIPVINGSAQPQLWYLEYGWGLVDRVDAYVIHSSTVTPLLHYDDGNSSARSPVSYRKVVIPVTTLPGQSTELYVRVAWDEKGHIPLTAFRVWTPDRFVAKSSGEYMVYGMFFGGLFVALLINLLWFVLVKDRSHLYYVFYVGSVTLFWLAINGLGGEYIWGKNAYLVDYAAALSMLLSTATASVYTRSFLGTADRAPVVDRALSMLGWVSLSAIAASAAGPMTVGIYMSYFLGPLLILFPFIGIHILRQGYAPAWLYTVAWSVFAVGTLVFYLVRMGAIPFSDIAEWGAQFGNWVEAVLLSVALAVRYKVLQKEKRAVLEQHQRMLIEANEKLEARVAERTAELRHAKEEAENLARLDGLTGIFNRRAFMEQAALLVSQAQRYGHPLTVVVLDIDYFKRLNDGYGHAAGDEALKAVVRLLKNIVRKADILGRIGGEEFAMLLPDTSVSAALDMARRARLGIERFEFRHDHQLIPMTASFGVGQFDRQRDQSISDAMARADKALYLAKESGRNRVEAFRFSTDDCSGSDTRRICRD